MDRIQSCEASDAAWFFWFAYPGHSRTTTLSVYRRAIATVSSVLPESTTMISSAQAADASARPMSPASFLVMTVTETFGTQGSLLELRIADCGLRIADCGLERLEAKTLKSQISSLNSQDRRVLSFET